jgi:hypothetical protein
MVSYYDHDTDTITVYPIDDLMMAAFYGIQMNGILYTGVLNEKVLGSAYEDVPHQLTSNLNYEEIFGRIHQDNGDDYFPDISNIKLDDNSDDKIQNNKQKDKKKIKNKENISIYDLKQYPCCYYSVDVKGNVFEVCSEDFTQGAHHCFGCEVDFVKTSNHQNVPIHQQMFDFNNFITNTVKHSDKHYTIKFDKNQNPPYQHASYSDMGRGEVVTQVEENISKQSWVTSMDIKIKKESDEYYEFIVTYIGIDWF